VIYDLIYTLVDGRGQRYKVMALVVQCSDASSSLFSPPSSILFFSRLPLLPSSFMAYRKPSQLASTYPAQFIISTLERTPFLLYTNKLVQIKLPAPPANAAEGGKASLQPECTVPVSEREIEAVQARKTFFAILRLQDAEHFDKIT